MLVVIIALAVTPRPFLCLHKEKGKEMHLLMRRRRLRRASNIVFNPASQDFITRAAVRGEKLMQKDNVYVRHSDEGMLRAPL